MYQIEYKRPYEQDYVLSRHMTYTECVEYAKELVANGYEVLSC